MKQKEEGTDLLVRTRRYLHTNPELSHREYRTTEFILDFLQTHASPGQIHALNQTGAFCVFEGLETGPTTMIRADIDALPIRENSKLAYHSAVDGVSHKCGHDGHTTILLGVAVRLSRQPIRAGRVLLLFQPAEEVGEGAGKVMEDEAFRQYNIDNAFALHNLPHYPAHAIVIREGVFTAHVKSLIIELKGTTAHAAEPEHGQNPATAIAKILLAAEELNHNDPLSESFFLMTPVYASLGSKAYGVSAGEGEIHFTIRAWSTNLFNGQCTGFLEKVRTIAGESGVGVSFSWTQEFEANINHPESVKLVRDAAGKLGLDIRVLDTPFKWGEDFGKFTQNLKGAMFGLGSGQEVRALHHPEYDFPDEIIQTGVDMFNRIIMEIHGSTEALDNN